VCAFRRVNSSSFDALGLRRMCVVMDVGLVEVLPRDILVWQVCVLQVGVIVLVPVRRQQVFNHSPWVCVVRDMHVFVAMNNGGMRMCLESLPGHLVVPPSR
jgi:hypothetical protein